MATLAAVIVLLPALLAGWAEHRKARGKPIKSSVSFGSLGNLASFMGRHRRSVIVLGTFATVLGFWSGTRLDWEWNWMMLEPEGIRSVDLQDEIIDRFKLSVSMSMLTAESVEDSRRLRKEFKDKRVVGEVDDLSLWVSRSDFDETHAYIEELRHHLEADHSASTFSVADDGAPDRRARLAEELDRLWANIVEIQALSFTGGQDRVVEKTRQIVASRDERESGLLRRVADRFEEGNHVVWEDFDRFSDCFHREMSSRSRRMAEGEGVVTLEMVPEDIAAKYISRQASGFLLHVYPKKNLFEREDLEIFRDVVSRVHPNVTGLPQMFLLMNLETIREGRLALLAAVGVIFLVLLLDFKRPLIATLAFLPVISGIALTLAVMWLLGEKLNYLNIIALPVIVGIGVDDGVHFFHRYIQEGPGGLRRAFTSVGRAMLMTSLTTMIGFGSLMLYLMRGMASMGLVLFVGVGMCFLVTITLLPALARVFEKRVFTAT
jgi:predicted RND superfamily exporter protein